MGLNVTAPVRQIGSVPFTASADDHPHYAAVTRWLISFLTKKGSRKVVSNYGTSFLTLIRAGAVHDGVTLRQIFDSSSKKAISDATSEVNVNVEEVILQKYTVIDDGLTLLLDFKFDDGTHGIKYIKVV